MDGVNGKSNFFFRPLKILDGDRNILYGITEAKFSNTQTLDLLKVE